MAVDKKISQLTSLAQVDVAASTDVLPIVDTSATETKKITVSALVGAGATAGLTNVDINSGTIDGTTIGASSASTGAFTTLSATGVTTLQAGSASAPAATTTGDTNTGIYFPAADQVAVTTGGTVAAAFNTNGLFFRNRIINGDMRIDQRNAGASITLSTTTQWPVDRWSSYKGTAGATVTAQQSSTAPTGFTNSIVYTASTGATPAAGDVNGFWQQLEGFNVADLGWGAANAQTVTLSFWVRSSVTGTYSVSFTNSAANRFYVATYTVNSANTYEYKTITVAGDTSGTWLTNNGVGIQIVWDLGYGTNFNGTAGSWSGSTIRRTSGSVQLIATTGATLYITGVQLETGSVATPFERRLLSDELMRCYRYFETSLTAAPSSSLSIAEAGWLPTAGVGVTTPISLLYRVQKRATPTFTIYAPGTATFTNYVREGDTGTFRAVGGSLINQNSLVFGVTSGAASAYYQCGYAVSAEL